MRGIALACEAFDPARIVGDDAATSRWSLI
jgi:hypothetical protein